MQVPLRIAVWIATYKRPRLLAGLLAGLSSLTFARIDEPELHIIVVDNDVSGSSEPVARAGMTRWRLTYRVEAQRGIAQARNRALSEVKSEDFVVFIDDDEVPDPSWLEELLLAQSRYGADVISGPVFPSFAPDAPGWVVKGDFFDPLPHKSGDHLSWCATNNTMVAARVFQAVPRFDPRFQLSGADDLHFFLSVARAGFNIFWTEDAVVREMVPPERARFGWLLRRAYRGGNCYSLVEAALHPGWNTRVLRLLKGCLRILQGALELAGGIVFGQAHAVRSLRRVCLGAGMLTGSFDLTYQSYSTVTGD